MKSLKSEFSIIKCVAEEKVKTPDLRVVEQIGFTDQNAGNGSKYSSRLDWIEVYGKEKNAPKRPPPVVKSVRVNAHLPDSVEAHENLVFAQYGDRELTLNLYKPKDATEPLPAVIFIFEGGHSKQSSQIQACVVMAGSMDWRTKEEQKKAAEDPRRRLYTFLNGSFETAMQTYHNASPVFHVSKATPPMCFMDGEFDKPGTRYGDMIQKLDTLGIYHESHIIEKGPHPYWTSHPFFEPALEIMVGFFDRVLKGE